MVITKRSIFPGQFSEMVSDVLNTINLTYTRSSLSPWIFSLDNLHNEPVSLHFHPQCMTPLGLCNLKVIPSHKPNCLIVWIYHWLFHHKDSWLILSNFLIFKFLPIFSSFLYFCECITVFTSNLHLWNVRTNFFAIAMSAIFAHST